MQTLRAARSLLAGASLIVVVAACGGAPASLAPSVAPSTAPTVAPTATPSPEPSADIIGALTRQLQDPAFAAHFDLAGEMTVAALEFDLNGTYDVDGDDYTTVFEAAGGAAGTSRTETRHVDGNEFVRQDEGVWLIEEASGSGFDFGTFSLGLEDAGVETRDGRQLHRLTLADPAGLDPQIVGIDPDEIGDLEIGMEFFATDAGELAILAMTMSGSVANGDQQLPMEMAIDFVLDDGAAAEVAKAPEDPWTLVSSEEYGYSIGLPDGWTADGIDEDGAEVFSSDGASLTVVPYEIDAGTTLAEYGEGVLAELAEIGFEGPENSVDVAFGKGAAAEPGIAYLYSGVEIEFEDDNLVYAVTIHDDTAYDFAWAFDAGDFGAQGTLVDQFLTTFDWE